MPNDFDERTAEPFVGEVLGLRAFRIDPSTGTLGGLTYHQEIASGVNVAQCAFHEGEAEHVAPHPGCSCGWYAYDEARHWPGAHSGALTFTAVVRLSGQIVVCERGLKAQYMEVIAATALPAVIPVIQKALPGVAMFADEESMLAAHPPQKVSRDDAEEGGGEQSAPAVHAVQHQVGVWAKLRAVVSHTWSNLTSNPAVRDPVTRLLWATLRLTLCAMFLCALMLASRGVFPPGSVGGFGALVPFGIFIALSPLLNLWRSPTGLLAYILLLSYGLGGSTGTLEAALGGSPVTPGQMVVIVLSLYGVPIFLLVQCLMKRFASTSSQRGSVVARGAVVAGNSVVLGAAGRGKTIAVRPNYLPKKIKSDSGRNGNSSPDTPEEGGQHG